MIITCPQCSTKFRLNDDLLPEGEAKVRCSRCRQVFEVRKDAPGEETFFTEDEAAKEFGSQEETSKSWRTLLLSWKGGVAALAVIVVAGGLIYFFLGKDRVPAQAASRPFPAVGEFLAGRAADLKKISLSVSSLKKYVGLGSAKEGFISVEKVKGYYLETSDQNRIFVIEGEAVNHWKESRSFLKVKGALLDTKGTKVREREVYCGNILSEKDLKEMSREAIEKSLSSNFGNSFSNVNIQPGKGVPFMIVFPDLNPQAASKSGPAGGGRPGEILQGLSDFTVEAVSSQKGTK